MKKEDSEKDEPGGLSIDKHGISCLVCRCRRKVFQKERKKTIGKEGEVIIEEVVNSISTGFGRGTTEPEQQPRTFTVDEKIKDLEKQIQEVKDKMISDIDAGFRRGISLDDKIQNLQKQIDDLRNINKFSLMD